MLVPMVLAALLLAQHAAAPHSGRIVASVVDMQDAAIPAAQVRVVQSKTASLVATARTDRNGEFRIEGLAPGGYVLRIRATGFRARDLGFRVRSGRTAKVSLVRLEVGGCDAPGASCDVFIIPPPNSGRKAHIEESTGGSYVKLGYLNLGVGCSADFAANAAPCAAGVDARPGRDDLTLVREQEHLYLVSPRGRSISTPNSSQRECRKAKFPLARLRIDGLGPGYDVCVRTHEGYVAHVYFPQDVEPGATSVRLWQVTHK